MEKWPHNPPPNNLATQPRALPQLCRSERPSSTRGLTGQSNVWLKEQEQSKVPVTKYSKDKAAHYEIFSI